MIIIVSGKILHREKISDVNFESSYFRIKCIKVKK